MFHCYSNVFGYWLFNSLFEFNKITRLAVVAIYILFLTRGLRVIFVKGKGIMVPTQTLCSA